MKNIQLITLILVSFFGISCQKNEETLKLNNLLKTFNLHISDYKVVCFVPIDGCGTCIDPTIQFARTANNKLLLVMSSMYKKSIDFTIEKFVINGQSYISDNTNSSIKKGLSSNKAPCFYFINNGEVIRKVDLLLIYDKVSILKEVDKFLVEK